MKRFSHLAPLVLVVAMLIAIGRRSDAQVSPSYVYLCGGTGFLHVTSDVEDGNCTAVRLATSDVTGVLPASKGGTGTSSFPAPGASGNVLESNGASWTSALPPPANLSTATGTLDLATKTTGILPPANGGSGWVTGIDVSFAGVTNPGLSTNGVKTLAGLTVNRENAASDNAPMTISAGGIVITPKVSSYAPEAATRTAPLLWFGISQASSGIDWASGLRLVLRISSSSQGAFDNGHGVYVGVDADGTSYASYCRQGSNGGNLRQFSAAVAVNGTGTRTNRNAGGSMSTGAVVFTCEIPQIILGNSQAVATWRDSVAAWPNLSTLNPVVAATQALSPFDAINGSNAAASSLLGVVIAADSPNSVNDAYVVTVSNLRVDYRP